MKRLELIEKYYKLLHLKNYAHRAENPLGISEVGENKQILIAIVVASFSFLIF
jgi:hypothetical protein